MSETVRQLRQLAPNPHNPRRITDKKLRQLREAMKKFGDLSGVVVNVSDGQNRLVGGHQRVRVLPEQATITIDHEYGKPTKTGTLREGHIDLDGERYAYREVVWDERTEKAASIAANQNAGEWDLTGLTSWLNELNATGFDMDLTMFSEEELAPYLPDPGDMARLDPGPQPSFPPPEQTGPAQDAVVHSSAQDEERPLNQVKAVQIFYGPEEYKVFMEHADALGDTYGCKNLSETILEAMRRAAATAAFSKG